MEDEKLKEVEGNENGAEMEAEKTENNPDVASQSEESEK